MAQDFQPSGIEGSRAQVYDDPRDQLSSVSDLQKPKDELAELTAWVLTRVNLWRDHRRQTYENLWDVYERLWRAMWSPEDKNKKSERSMFVTPGMSEAVENIVAEVEEAVWGRGDSFDMKAPFRADENAKKIVDDNKALLKEDLGRAEFNVNVGEALINAAVYGSGIGEILVEKFIKREITASMPSAFPMPANPATPTDGLAQSPLQAASPVPGMPPMPGAAPQTPLQAPTMQPGVGSQSLEAKVIEREMSVGTLQSVNPRNFLIEPTARTIDKALGVAIEEYVGAHIIKQGQENGSYRDVDVGTSAGDTQLGADRQAENEYVYDKVHVIRYYGLVPKHLLFPPGQTVDLSSNDLGDEMGLAVRSAEDTAEGVGDQVQGENDVSDLEFGEKSTEPVSAEMVEAVVFIANNSIAIKAMENPALMKDRPVVAFPWDIVPGRFWGRGVCEKGMVPQRVMDAEMRARIDALAFISAPMMGMDASRLPRGFQLKVRPGKSILTNGKPSDVLMPMHFGQLDPSTFNQSQQLDQMIQRATGSLDVISLAQKTGGDSRPGAVSMMLSGIVKRHKRTLMNFVDRFYVPALRKILWRNMQYAPERYTPRNWDFVASSTMGILQREYESQQLTALLQTMEPQSPEYKMILMGIVSNTGLSARREIIDMLQQSIQTAQQAASAQAQVGADPQTIQLQAQVQQRALQVQIAESEAKIRELESRASLQDQKAQNAMLEPKFRAMELATKGIYQVAKDQQDTEFNRRMEVADRVLKARDIASNERIATAQSQASLMSHAIAAKAKARGEAMKAAASKPQVVPVPHPVPVPVPHPVPVGPAPFIGRRAIPIA